MRCGLRALGGTKAGDARACGPRGDSLARTREPKGQNCQSMGPVLHPRHKGSAPSTETAIRARKGHCMIAVSRRNERITMLRRNIHIHTTGVLVSPSKVSTANCSLLCAKPFFDFDNLISPRHKNARDSRAPPAASTEGGPHTGRGASRKPYVSDAKYPPPQALNMPRVQAPVWSPHARGCLRTARTAHRPPIGKPTHGA